MTVKTRSSWAQLCSMAAWCRWDVALIYKVIQVPPGFINSLIHNECEAFSITYWAKWKGKWYYLGASKGFPRNEHLLCVVIEPNCRPVFFAKNTVSGINYLGILQNWLIMRLIEHDSTFIFQQDRAPPHFHENVNAKLLNCFIGKVEAVYKLPPCFPQLTPRVFFVWFM